MLMHLGAGRTVGPHISKSARGRWRWSIRFPLGRRLDRLLFLRLPPEGRDGFALFDLVRLDVIRGRDGIGLAAHGVGPSVKSVIQRRPHLMACRSLAKQSFSVSHAPWRTIWQRQRPFRIR